MAQVTKQRLIRRMEVKALDLDTRTFEGLAATYDLDLQWDVIEPGSFKQTIRDWKKSGDILPLLDSHSWFSIFDTIGKLIDIEERDSGLWTKWKVIPGPKGDEVLQLLSTENGGPFIDRMSIGYNALDWRYAEDPDTGQEIRYLSKIRLNEVSLVRFPANPMAMTDPDTVKSLLTHELTVLERFAGQAPSEVKDAMKDVLRGAIQRCEDGKCDPDPKSRKRETKDDGGEPANKGGGAAPYEDPDGDPNAPDRSKFDQLRLRQLDFRTTHRGALTNV